MKKIMFVCHGNICRSPMAEFIFKDLVKKAGRENEFTIASCATSTEEIGCSIYPPAKKILREKGIEFNERSAVQLKRADYDKYDLFIGMDDANIRNMLRIFGEDKCRKVRKLMDYTEKGGNVADPWYTGNFSITYDDISEGCKKLLENI